jgi:hypothetical protein
VPIARLAPRLLKERAMRTTWPLLLSFFVLVALARAVNAAPTCVPSRLTIVLDRSSSMRGDKWAAAREAIDRVAAAYEGSIELGLATFPYPDECGPGRVEVPGALGQRLAIASALREEPPESGAWTPLGETLLALAQDDAVTGGRGPAHAVVITDGFQWCSPYDPEARGLPIIGVKVLRDAGVTSFVVGFGNGVDEITLDRMAETAGTARAGCVPGSADPATRCYYQADDPAQLVAVLMDIAATSAAETCDHMDNDCDGEIDEDACPPPPPAVDAGADAFADDTYDPVGVPGGCGCGAAADAGGAAAGLLVFGAGLVWLLRPRRRRARDQARR